MGREACPSPNENCPYAERPGGCFSDEHHIYYPKVDYRDIMGSEFRGLPENKEQLCRWEHNEKHAQESPPQRPSREEMLGSIVAAVETGQIYLSRNKRRRLGL